MKTLYLKLSLATFFALLFGNLLVPFITEPLSNIDEFPLSDSKLGQLETDLIQHLQASPNDTSALAEIEQRYDIEVYLEPLTYSLDSPYEVEEEAIWLPEETDVIWTEMEENPQWIIPLYLDEPSDSETAVAAEQDSYAEQNEPQWLAHINTPPGLSSWFYELLYLIFGTALVSAAIIFILRIWSQPLAASKSLIDRQLAQLDEPGNQPEEGSTSEQNNQELPSALHSDLKQLVTQLIEQNKKLRSSEHEHIAPYQDLLHAIAHEFRSPMARLTFGLEMLNQSKSDQEYSELHHDMELALGDMDDLVKEVLNYVRLRDNRAELEYQEIHVPQVINSLIAKQQTLTPAIEFEKEGPDVAIFFVRHLFDRALINLVRNAARFASKRVLISWKNIDQGIELYVEDDGIGIPAGKRERIFEPFTRLDASRSRDSGGVGLGLSIVDTICQQHKGYVRVEDSELGGACFVIFLPNRGEQ